MPLNRECPKCGHGNARVRHNRVLEQMELACDVCKYEWMMKPLDIMREDKERQKRIQGGNDCPCPSHPFNCFGHPHSCACLQSEAPEKQ